MSLSSGTKHITLLSRFRATDPGLLIQSEIGIFCPEPNEYETRPSPLTGGYQDEGTCTLTLSFTLPHEKDMRHFEAKELSHIAVPHGNFRVTDKVWTVQRKNPSRALGGGQDKCQLTEMNTGFIAIANHPQRKFDDWFKAGDVLVTFGSENNGTIVRPWQHLDPPATSLVLTNSRNVTTMFGEDNRVSLSAEMELWREGEKRSGEGYTPFWPGATTHGYFGGPAFLSVSMVPDEE